MLVATCSMRLSDVVGGVLAVVAVAEEGERFGECRLTENSVMLLRQSARNVTVLRALRVSDWLKVLQPSDGEQRAGEREGGGFAGSADR